VRWSGNSTQSICVRLRAGYRVPPGRLRLAPSRSVPLAAQAESTSTSTRVTAVSIAPAMCCASGKRAARGPAALKPRCRSSSRRRTVGAARAAGVRSWSSCRRPTRSCSGRATAPSVSACARWRSRSIGCAGSRSSETQSFVPRRSSRWGRSLSAIDRALSCYEVSFPRRTRASPGRRGRRFGR
jgi:hypothetical protein